MNTHEDEGHQQAQQNVNDQRSVTHNEGAHFSNVGTIHNAPVSNQIVVRDNEVQYEGDRENTGLLEFVARMVVELIGEARTKVTSGLTFAAGVLSVTGYVYGLGPLLPRFETYLLYLGIVLVLLALLLFAAVRYKHESRCPECENYYSLQELDDPHVRELRTADCVRRTIRRKLTCRNCNATTTRTSTRLLENE